MARASRGLSPVGVIFLFFLLGAGAIVAAVYGIGNQRELARLRKEVEQFRTAQDALRREIAQERERPRPAPPRAGVPLRDVTMNLAGAPAKGEAAAPLTLVEFTDYECGFCARHVKQTLPQLEAEYIATGKLRYVFRNFPLESIHKKAFKAHEAALCAGDQGKFWEMHDALFANPRALAPADLTAHAAAVGLDSARFESCLAQGTHADKVRRDLADGKRAGVTGTPAFFLGTTTPDGAFKPLRFIKGARPYPGFKQEIDELLTKLPSR